MMSDPWFQSLFASRIGGASYSKNTDIFKFEKIKRAKRDAIRAHPDRRLLDFGIGENDVVAHTSILEVLREEVGKLENRGYADNGIQSFKDAAAEFMAESFGVHLCPQTEINHCIGSKSALAMLPACFIDSGDITLLTVPGYPIAGTHTQYYGGTIHALPLLPDHNFYPDLQTIPADVRTRSKLLVINYPNSPTGAIATEEFYKEVIAFAMNNEIIVVQDAAHVMLSYENPPLSFLQVEGAKEVGVEIHSLSKSFNMIGWRIGFVCGHQQIIQAFADIKDTFDSGQFIPIQKAAIKALKNSKISEEVQKKYKRRLQKLVNALREIGFDARMPGGTYFLYVPTPVGCKEGLFKSAEEVSQYFIQQCSVVCVPWDEAGTFLRFSTTYSAKDELEEDALMVELVKRLTSMELAF